MRTQFVKEGVSTAEWEILNKFARKYADVFVCTPERGVPENAIETGYVPKSLTPIATHLLKIEHEMHRWGLPQPFPTWYFHFSLDRKVRRWVRKRGNLFVWHAENGLPADPSFYQAGQPIIESNSAEGILRLHLSAQDAAELRKNGFEPGSPL